MVVAMRRLVPLAVVLALTPVASGDAPVLHDFVPSLAMGDVALVIEGESDEPLGILYDGDIVEAPTGAPTRDEVVESAGAIPPGGAAAPAPPTFRPDTLTGMHNSTGYYEVFTPAVAPYKRVESYDRVELAPDGTPVLTVASMQPRELPVIGTDAIAADGRPRDRFWGSVIVDFAAGARAKLASVSPESRILYVRTEPSVRVRIEVDSAGNQSVIALDPVTSVVRVTFLTDAPQSYFNTEAPAIRTDAQAAVVPRVPDAVRADALSFARSLGIATTDPLKLTLDRLVAHFRAFEQSEEPPRGTGNIYLDLARGGVGVCRHRAYAFVVTALSLGIPAHYLQNEAHAWVEVRLGDAGFVRIDLGGSSTAVQGHGLEDRPAYTPVSADPFPQPEAFIRSYLSMQGTGSTPFSNVGETRGEGNDGQSGQPSGHSPTAQGTAPSGAPGEATTSASSTQPARDLAPTQTLVETRNHTVLRGRTLDLRGAVHDENGAGLPGMRVDVYVVTQGEERRLGAAVTGPEGRFSASVTVPQDLSLGHHTLRVRAAGDSRHAASVAQ